MTTPTGLHLFSPLWFEPIDRSTQITRFPPTDAPCQCEQPHCLFPWCPYKAPEDRAPP